MPILASLTGLSLLGETINVMTLGGLALAVGILVDDATVTIENINWHLEQGKEIEPAILDGARQIVVPATVSLLCICIAFVPMFGLGGVAGYLFRPLAEAVVFALIASYVLSRTLVPTMANYLLRNQHASAAVRSRRAPIHAPAKPSRNPLRALPAAASSAISKRPQRLSAACCSSACTTAIKVIAGFLGFSLLSFGACALSRPGFLPDRRWRPDQAARPRADRHADRGNDQALPTGSATAIHSIIPADRARRHRQQYRAHASAASTWPTTTPAPSASRTPTS